MGFKMLSISDHASCSYYSNMSPCRLRIGHLEKLTLVIHLFVFLLSYVTYGALTRHRTISFLFMSNENVFQGFWNQNTQSYLTHADAVPRTGQIDNHTYQNGP